MWQDLGIADCGLKGRERGNESVKQSQIERSVKFEVSGSTPALGGDPSRGRLGHMVANPARETKPICLTQRTTEAIMQNKPNLACRAGGGHSPPYARARRAKQSQLWAGGPGIADCGLKGQQRMGEAVKQSQFALADRWCARHTLRSGGCIARNKANFRQ